MAILQVGANLTGGAAHYATLTAALAASHDGDIIQLQAGDYYQDAAIDVAAAVTIEGVGGMAHLYATQSLGTGRALLRTHTNGGLITLRNLEMSGAVDYYGNGSAVLHVGGDLLMDHCYVHGNEEGLLAGSDVAAIGTITIANSEFADNGSGDGYTHNIYVNNNGAGYLTGDTLNITNSYIHGAKVGHEVKSRAAVTNIANSVIADGPYGDASYVIDLPNGGVASITGSVIQKGANSPNHQAVISFGEEGAAAGSTIQVTGNTIVNYLTLFTPPTVRVAGGTATILGNALYNLAPIPANTVITSLPSAVAPPPWLTPNTYLWQGGAAPGIDPNDGRFAVNWRLVNGNGTTSPAQFHPMAYDIVRINAGVLDLAGTSANPLQLTANTVLVGGGAALNLTDVALDGRSSILSQTAGVAATLNAFGVLATAGAIGTSGAGGSLTVNIAASANPGSGLLVNSGLLAAHASATLALNGAGGASVRNTGAMLADGGVLRVRTDLAAATGGIGAVSGGVELGGAVGAGQSVLFLDNAVRLTLGAGPQFAGRILGMQAGDAIDLPGIDPNGVVLSGFGTANPDTLVVTSGAYVARLSFRDAGMALGGFSAVTDTTGGTLIRTTSVNPYWVAAGSPAGLTGAFETAANWSTGAAPGGGANVIVAALSSTPYKVGLGTDTIASLLLASPAATLRVNGKLTATGAILHAGGVFVVGGGGAVQAQSFQQTNNGGDLQVLSGVAGATAMLLTGAVALDIESTGTIDNAKLDASAGAVIVGQGGGTGALTAQNSATVLAGSTALGVGAGATGSLTVINATTYADGATRIGDGGNGHLLVTFAGVLNDVSAGLATTAASRGDAIVSGNGVWNLAGDLDIGAAGAGAVSAQVAGTSGGRGAGAIKAAGTMRLGGTVSGYGGGVGTLSVTDGSQVVVGQAIMWQGSAITVDAASQLRIGALAGAGTAGALQIDAAHGLSGAGRVNAAIVNAGTLAANVAGQALDVTGPVSGSGLLQVSAGAQLFLEGAVGAGQSLSFGSTATAEMLRIGQSLTMQAAISGFAWQDTIVFQSLVYQPGYQIGSYAGGLLTIIDALSATIASLTIAPSVSGGFALGQSGGMLALAVNCFAAGTAIATGNGPVAIERLRPGDLVVTVERGAEVLLPVRWIGQRRIDLAAHPRPEQAAPIRIRRDAFAAGVPCRDLLVSPDHCLFIDGGLIPAKLLRNDRTILRQDAMASVHYFHVELDRHAVLLAEGLAAESYLDTGNRGNFANAPGLALLHPVFAVDAGAPAWRNDACAPLTVRAVSVAPVWRALADRARLLGHADPVIHTIDEPALRLRAGARTIAPVSVEADRHVFLLPPGVVDIRIVSRAAMPSATTPYLDDFRRLGVAVGRIVLRAGADVIEVPADHPGLLDGWHAPEREGVAIWRWTDGDARLALPRVADAPVILELWLRSRMTYPMRPAGQFPAAA